MNTSKTKTGLRVGIGGIAVIGILVLFIMMFAVERIDSGQTGIIVNLAGSERGVDNAKMKTVPTSEYYIERENAKVVFLRYRKTTEELEQSVILTEVKNAYKDVAGMYETDSLINNRPAFEKEVEVLLKERLSLRGFTFTNIQSSVKPNEVLQAAIDAKNTAVQNALKVENEKKAAIAEAEKVVAAAKGKADANRILQQSITPELIQLKAVEKWDGKLPLSTSGNTLPFLQLK